jgi:hypothetical protein
MGQSPRIDKENYSRQSGEEWIPPRHALHCGVRSRVKTVAAQLSNNGDNQPHSSVRRNPLMEGKKYPSPERSGAKSLLISLREFGSREIQRGSDAIRGVPSLESRVGTLFDVHQGRVRALGIPACCLW